jgi:hypothetical protein
VNDLLKKEVTSGQTAHSVRLAYERLADSKPGAPRRKQSQRQASPPPRRPPSLGAAQYWAKFPDAIDDPHFTSEYGRTKADLLAEEATFLVTVAGLTRTQAAIRLGKDKTYVDRVLGPIDMRKAA